MASSTASPLDMTAEWEVLRNTMRIASSIRDELNISHLISTPCLVPDVTIPNLFLPFPGDILAPITNLQIPHNVCQAILQRFNRLLKELQERYTSAYLRACKASVQNATFDNDLTAIQRAYQALYSRHCLPMLRSRVSFVLAEVAKYQHCESGEVKRPFNNEYTPVLEKYFDYNAYPSAKHQEILAEKSMMSKRQIEVWFQNHRNRSKKDGKTLRRLTSELPLQLALSALQERTPFSPDRSPTPLDEDWASESMDEDAEPLQPTSCIEAFESFRPLHAFPTSFAAAKSGPDPFTCDDGIFKFPPPTWMRKPATAPPPSTTSSPIDTNEFALMFQLKLNILEGTRKRAPTSKPSTTQPWFAATVTVPPRAPHVALISKPLPSCPSSTILPISSNSFSFQFPMGSGTTSATNAFLPPPPPQSATPTTPSRKISPLPRRVPMASNLSSTAPSSPRTLSSSSRTSSFSSDTSSRSRISSSSSTYSSPEPSTPPPLPNMEIPAVQDPGLVQQQPEEVNFSDLFGADPDHELFASLSSMNFDFSMNHMLNKQPPTALFDMNSFVSMPTSDYMATQS